MLKIALVGCGRWGIRYLPILQAAPALLMTVCDPDQKVLIEVKQHHPALTVYADLGECLAQSSADAYIVATPPSTHYSLTKTIIKAGKHVLVEKPVCENMAQAEELVQLAQQEKVVLMAGHLLAYQPATALARLCLRDMDPPRYVRAIRCADNLSGASNVLYDLLVHDLARLRYILDLQPLELLALGSPQHSVSVILRCKEGCHVHLTASWIEPELSRRLEMFWSDSMLVIDDTMQQGVGIVFRHGDNLVKTFKAAPGDALLEQCHHFARAIATGTVPRTGPQDILWVTTALTLAQMSLNDQGRWVSWPSDDDTLTSPTAARHGP